MRMKLNTINHERVRSLVYGYVALMLLGFAAPAQAVIWHTGAGTIDGSLCIGFDCPATPAFGFDTLRLQENNLRLHFDDTSNTASFPDRDWRIIINDSANGGSEYFAIEDTSAGYQAFRIAGDSQANALTVDAQGDIGVGTLFAALDLHIKRGDTPSIRLEQDSSSGFTPQTWDLAGNEASFFVRDATNGSTLPFRIRSGAPSSSIDINDEGKVGMGIGGSNVQANLHIRDIAGSGVDDLIKLENNGNVRISLENTDAATDWLFLNQGAAFAVSLNGSGTTEFRIFDDGDAILAGMLTELSDVNAKTNIRDLDPQQVLTKVSELPIHRWQYKKDQGVDHIGPMAQDFHASFGLGDDDKYIGSMDTSGVALAAIKALLQKQTALEDENRQLKSSHRELLVSFHQQQEFLQQLKDAVFEGL